MRSYVVTFTSRDGDTCEIDQPARTAVAAVTAVHNYCGFLTRVEVYDPRPVTHYQVHTAHGIETYRVVAWSGTRPNRTRPVLI